MMKLYYLFIISVFLIFSSCENPEDKEPVIGDAEISILYPENNTVIIYDNEPIEIKVIVTNKENATAGYVKIENDIIASGLNDTITAYYEPVSNMSQNLQINAELTNEENVIIASDFHNISLNSIDFNTSSFETIFMTVDDQFQMMRFPVTNREFLFFLNNNQNLNVIIEDINWDDSNGNSYGNPELCEFDSGDNYEPTNWWYAGVTSQYASATISPNEYIIYRDAYNKYDTNANFSEQAGRIRYDCLSESFYLPLEEEIYLDHPVVGVSWIGANVYANYFGWTIPSLTQWKVAAKGDSETFDTLLYTYPWGNEINQNYANYNSSNTSQIGYYNGIGERNLSLSPYGIYDMTGNVWEHTSSTSPNQDTIYFKTGGAFNTSSDELEKLETGYKAYASLEHTSMNTGFRCITNIDYPSENPSGCIDEEACNFDSFAQNSTECYQDDCLNVCNGNAQLITVYQDLDLDGLGNPNITEIQCNEPSYLWADNPDDLNDDCLSTNENQNNIDCSSACNGTAFIDQCDACVAADDDTCIEGCDGNWANDGSHALDDECDICNGDNSSCTDCNGDMNGEAYIDGCSTCVGGETGIEPCPTDCFGYDGGTAFIDECDICVTADDDTCIEGCDGNWANDGSHALDDECDICNGDNSSCADCNGDPNGIAVLDGCGICSGGNTEHAFNSDQDCNGECFGSASEDECGICDGLGAIEYHCLDTNFNGCCDCSEDFNTCSPEDVDIVCENAANNDTIAILGCANEDAENYYCDENECSGNNLPCNFVHDGSCIIYGCSDSIADNFDEQATICSDGSESSCCLYTEPLIVSFGNIDIASGIMEINIIVPEYEDNTDYIYGFQFNIDGININGASGGLAEDAGFTLTTGGTTVIGFSFSGTYIDAGSGILTEISFTPSGSQACLNIGSGAFSNQNSQSIPVIFGECFDF